MKPFHPYLAFFLLLPGMLPAQGPLDGYLKGKGALDIAPSFSFLSSRKFDGARGFTYDEAYKGQMLSLFAAYGLHQKIDVVATAAAVFTQQQSGLQDGGIFLKYRPLYFPVGNAGKVAALLGGGATFPMSNYTPSSAGALGQKAVTVPLRLMLQWETPLGLFFHAGGGYHFRLDRLQEPDIARIRQQRPDYQPIEPEDFSTLLLKIGFPARHFYLDGWVEWLHTRGGVDFVQNVPDLPQSYAVSYTQLGGTLYYSDEGRSGFYLSGAYIPGGRNTARMERLSFGMVFKILPSKKR